MTNTEFTNEHLKYLQSMPLDIKIGLTTNRIREWLREYDAYISFSGGKDSTVLLHIARKLRPSIKAVYIDTGLEYPEVRDFVTTIENVEWLYPLVWDKHKRKYVRTSFRKVIETYGYPIISKEQAAFIQEYRDTKSEKLKQIRLKGNKYGRGKISQKYQYLIDAPFKISDKCCDIMKKNPAKVFEKETGMTPIIGTMTHESMQRKSNWLMYGCNAFNSKRPTSRPMSFWTEQDVLQYLLEYNVPYASVYGEIKEDENGKLYTTGCDRTGCVFCGFGCHLDKEPNRFQRLHETHPKLWEYCMRDWEDGGLGMKNVLNYINVNIQ